MRVIEQPLTGGPKQTGKLMHWMANAYQEDLVPYTHLCPSEMFNIIKTIPYGYDPHGIEVINRPRHTLNGETPWSDCDDKAIIAAAYALKKGIPYKFKAIGRRDPRLKWWQKTGLQHVYPILYLNGRWTPFDATYEFNTIGREMGPYDASAFI